MLYGYDVRAAIGSNDELQVRTCLHFLRDAFCLIMCDIMQGLGDPDIPHFAGYNCGERVDIAGYCNIRLDSGRGLVPNSKYPYCEEAKRKKSYR